ncbi:hypothetical protein DMB65_08135 [Flavobacterium cheongpyeongense]|uniref:Uncharacterized protein n=2 Tax=Flavobacterium cheongpyeongense TaxID=2212651 RepID=A0A2V4BR02_9FLAO|nr:hypothetical protein DMB65_08135 [Flavobacterium cheongpyeongense]
MMMLSLVSERAANFIKLYFQGKEIYIPFISKIKGKWQYYLKVRLEILAYKQPTEMAEKEREYRVMIINVLVGIVIASLANASLFELIKQISSNENESIAIKGILFNNDNAWNLIVGAIYMLFFLWSMSLILFSRLPEFESDNKKKNYKTPLIIWFVTTVIIVIVYKIGENMKDPFRTDLDFLSIVRHVMGYIFTGLFLSLGSKFWHDLLDIFFQLKNTQQVLSDKKTYTDYDSADKLISLAETPQYDIAEGLYGIYKDQIKDIEGVVSHGLTTVLDDTTKLYKKIIEVEFTNPEAQEKLQRLKFSGSIVLKLNTFYLKDYLRILKTDYLRALTTTETPPLCYVCNADSTSNMGSFNTLIRNEKYYAVSNLHVFADEKELIDFNSGKINHFTKTAIHFNIQGKVFLSDFEADGLQFGNKNFEGKDQCFAPITKDIYVAHQNFLSQYNLNNFSPSRMVLFGATSKYLEIPRFSDLQPTDCSIKYKGFVKQLNLIKIDCQNDNNVDFGDSGSFVYYKIKTGQTTSIKKGVIVAKSQNFAFMFRYSN